MLPTSASCKQRLQHDTFLRVVELRASGALLPEQEQLLLHAMTSYAASYGDPNEPPGIKRIRTTPGGLDEAREGRGDADDEEACAAPSGLDGRKAAHQDAALSSHHSAETQEYSPGLADTPQSHPAAAKKALQAAGWAKLPAAFMASVVAKVQGDVQGGDSLPQPWCNSRLVCSTWARAFALNLRCWDLSRQNSLCSTAPPPRSGVPSAGLDRQRGVSGTALFGCYMEWAALRFPNVSELSLPPLRVHDEYGQGFISFRSSSWITGVMASLRSLRGLLELEWSHCEMLRDNDLTRLPELLPQLRSLKLNNGFQASSVFQQDSDLWRPEVSDRGLEALAKLTCLRLLHLELPYNLGTVTSRGVAALSSLTDLTSLTCTCQHLDDEGLVRMASLVSLQELYLLGSEFYLDMDNEPDSSDATDEGLVALGSLRNLRALVIPWCPGWTQKGQQRLSAQLPQLGGADAPPPQ